MNKQMRRKRREASQLQRLHIHQSKLIFSSQIQVQSCGICSIPGDTLINPCECPTKYHQRCLLLFIRRLIRRSLKENEEVDLTTIKCRVCDNQFHISYSCHSQYNCTVFQKRIQKNCCNKHVVVITFLLIVIIITITIFINLGSQKKLSYGLIALMVLQGLILLIISSHFIQTYLLYKQIILERVLEIIQLRSHGSNSSEENRISDDWDVVVRGSNK